MHVSKRVSPHTRPGRRRRWFRRPRWTRLIFLLELPTFGTTTTTTIFAIEMRELLLASVERWQGGEIEVSRQCLPEPFKELNNCLRRRGLGRESSRKGCSFHRVVRQVRPLRWPRGCAGCCTCLRNARYSLSAGI